MYQLIVYIPKTALETVKNALFKAGAGKLGDYEQCCWQVEGQGQFKALPGSNPYLGTLNQLSHEAEFKVEMICQDQYIRQVEQALLAAHPYETPAYAIIKLENT